ncbi:MAG: glycosyltransferase family 4 protein [Planctomycetota bacterium]|jgi:glycosyltransferase involved in cell wall biosynthesis
MTAAESVKIAQLAPGSGDNFYCENCLRDAALVRAMRKLGYDVLMIPMYLPLQADKSERVSNAPIFFGGVNVYLQQKLSFFQRTPRWFDSLFDWPKLLEWVGRRAQMTSARDLGETTISMLNGENGRQVKELDRLIEWLQMPDNKPDVVCLSNALLAGLASSIKSRLGVPIVCLLQDEDGFLDSLAGPYMKQAWEILARRLKDVDAFVAVSKYYANTMQERLGLDAERLHVVPAGISLEAYDKGPVQPEVPAIGYLSRMCPDKGLDVLAEAFIILKENEKLKDIRLIAAGGRTGHDRKFINQVERRLDWCGVIGDVEFLPGFEVDAKSDFFRRISVLSVPEKKPVAYGLYVLEALAAGVPVVEPEIGVFGELIETAGGGVLYKPNNAQALAGALEPLLLDADYALKLGARGRGGIFENFDVMQTAQNMVRIYKQVIQQAGV